MTFLISPFVWQAKKPIQFVSALETVIYQLMILYLCIHWKDVVKIGFIRYKYSWLLYLIVTSIIVGAAYTNFGLIVRQRCMVLPVIFLLFTGVRRQLSITKKKKPNKKSGLNRIPFTKNMPPTRKPKILICVTVAETAWSFFREQVPYLKEKGYSVEIASGEGSWKKLSDVREAFGVPVHKVPLTRAMNIVADIRSLVRLYFLMRQTKPAILHASTPKAAVLSLVAGWLAGCRCASTLSAALPTTRPRAWCGRCFPL